MLVLSHHVGVSPEPANYFLIGEMSLPEIKSVIHLPDDVKVGRVINGESDVAVVGIGNDSVPSEQTGICRSSEDQYVFAVMWLTRHAIDPMERVPVNCLDGQTYRIANDRCVTDQVEVCRPTLEAPGDKVDDGRIEQGTIGGDSDNSLSATLNGGAHIPTKDIVFIATMPADVKSVGEFYHDIVSLIYRSSDGNLVYGRRNA